MRKIGNGIYVPYTPGRDDVGDIAQCHRTAYRMARDVGGMPEFIGRVRCEDGRAQMHYRIVEGEPEGDLLRTEQALAARGQGRRPPRAVEWAPLKIFDTTLDAVNAST